MKIKLCVFETHFYTLDSMVIEQALKMQGVYEYNSYGPKSRASGLRKPHVSVWVPGTRSGEEQSGATPQLNGEFISISFCSV